MPEGPPSPTPSPVRTLAYSSSRTRTPRRTRAAIVLLLASNLYFIHDKWRPDLRARMLWHQRQCLRFEWPDGQVLFEGDPARAKALLAQPGYTPITSPGMAPGEHLAVSGEATEAYNAFRETERRMPASPAPLFGGVGAGFQIGSELVLFLGERTSPGGNVRLVVVMVNFQLPDQEFSFETLVVKPASPGGMPQDMAATRLSWQEFRVRASLYEEAPWVRMHAARADPVDRSRFTFEFETFYGRSVAEGRLKDDETVALKVISGAEADGSGDVDDRGG